MTDDWFESLVHVTWFISPNFVTPLVLTRMFALSSKSALSENPQDQHLQVCFSYFLNDNQNNRNDGLRLFCPPFFSHPIQLQQLDNESNVFFKVCRSGNGTGTQYPKERTMWKKQRCENSVSKVVFCFVWFCGKVGKVWFWQRSNNYSNAIWDYKSSLSNRDSTDI